MEIIRKAKEPDRPEVIECILDAFQDNFAEFIKSVGKEKVQSFLMDSLRIECFYVLEVDNQIIATFGLSDINGRALREIKTIAKKYFGPIFGWLLYIVNFREFEINYCNNEKTGFIEFVAVKQLYQGRGYAKSLIKHVIDSSRYERYLLDVVDNNHSAIKCYEKLGFVAIKREKVRFSKQKGFKERIFMEFSP